jgi:hypothetical protein
VSELSRGSQVGHEKETGLVKARAKSGSKKRTGFEIGILYQAGSTRRFRSGVMIYGSASTDDDGYLLSLASLLAFAYFVFERYLYTIYGGVLPATYLIYQEFDIIFHIKLSRGASALAFS